MRIFTLIFIMMSFIVTVNGCCCSLPPGMTGFNKNSNKYKPVNKQVTDDESDDIEGKQIAPLEAAMMMRKLQIEMQELMTEMENSEGLDEDELSELRAKIDEKQEEMMKLSEETVNSDFIKQKSDNKLIKRTLQQQRKAKELNDKAVMNQKQLIDEIEEKLDNQEVGEKFEEDITDDESFELDPENDSEFNDDIYLPDKF